MSQHTAPSARDRRTALSILSRDRLAELTAHFALHVTDRRVAANHVDALVRARDVEFEALLTLLRRDELKGMCEALGLDTGGREKQVLIDRILGREGETVWTPPTPPSSAPSPVEELAEQLGLSLEAHGRPEGDQTGEERTVPRRKGRGTKAGRPEGDQHARLMRGLWQAAVNLRGSIEPADYKRYVLPIIFLRFVSLSFERRRRQLASLIADAGSEYYVPASEVRDAVLSDPDEYHSAGAFVVPTEARWDYLQANARADDIKIKLDDALEALERAYPDKLRGLLPRIFAGSNLANENVAGLINLFSQEVFASQGGIDRIGQVYEYFIGEFANSEGKRGGEYFTPASIVRTLVAMLEPTRGIVFDPCCGSGGMFVQSDLFTHHSHELAFYGQDSKDFTYRLCRMNLFIHGIDGDIRLGNSYSADQHATLRADYVLANPPFNDGSKGENGWGADRVPQRDPRLKVGDRWMPLAPRNANTMWILHFLYHLKEGGTAGFVMATGELSSQEKARLAVRQALVEQGYVDCIVQLTGQLFANTQIPCSLWFLSKNRKGTHGFRRRKNEILFIDGRKLGTLIPGSRKQKELSAEEIERIAAVYRAFKRDRAPEAVPGFCRVAMLDEVRGQQWTLSAGRYVGTADLPDDDESFEIKVSHLIEKIEEQFVKARQLEVKIGHRLRELKNES